MTNQELNQAITRAENILPDLAEGDQRDTIQRHLESLCTLLNESTQEPPAFHYLLQVIGDVEPELHGPYPTAEERDTAAKEFRGDGGDMADGLYPIELKVWQIGNYFTQHTLEFSSYSGRFFEEETTP